MAVEIPTDGRRSSCRGSDQALLAGGGRQPVAKLGRGQGDLFALALTDRLSDGLSMVYSVYDPDLELRSLGTFMVLDHVERARKLGLPYVYLGYWVDGSPKMAYKARFLPQERLMPQGWERVG